MLHIYIRHRAACQRCWCDQWALSWQLGSLIGLAAWLWPPGLQLSYLFIGSPSPPVPELMATPSGSVFASKFLSLKKCLWSAIWCPKCSKVTPKASKLEPWAVIFITFFCKKPTLHPTAYLLCFKHILGVVGPPVLKKNLLQTCVGSRSQKKTVTCSL